MAQACMRLIQTYLWLWSSHRLQPKYPTKTSNDTEFSLGENIPSSVLTLHGEHLLGGAHHCHGHLHIQVNILGAGAGAGAGAG